MYIYFDILVESEEISLCASTTFHLDMPSGLIKENLNAQPSFHRLQPQAERP